MRLFISSDIEGTAGIAHLDETDPDKCSDLYRYFREQMTREVAAACEGALLGGAAAVHVKDAHDSGRNIIPTGLPRGVTLNRDWSGEALSMGAGVAKGFDAAAYTGYHSCAYSDGNPLAHTMNTTLFEIKLNGERISEFHLHALGAAHSGVPSIFLSGDKALCERAKEIVPGIVTVPVSEGVGGSSTSIHPMDAVERIRDGMKSAAGGFIATGGKDCFPAMPASFALEITYSTVAKAVRNSYYPGAKKIGVKTILFEADGYEEFQRATRFIL